MNILLVSERFYPQVVGSGTSAYLIAKELVNLGHKVSVATDAKIKLLLGRERLPFDMYYINSFEDYIMGRKSFQLPLLDIFNVLEKNDFDVIQVNNFMPMFLFTIIKPLVKPPIIFTFHNTPNGMERAIGYFKNQNLDIQLAKTIIQAEKYEMIVNGSKCYADFAIKLGANASHMKMAYLGIDQDEFKKQLSEYKNVDINQYFNQPLNNGDYLITLPGRVTPSKGIYEALKAFSLINNQNIKLLLTNMVSPFDKEFAAFIDKEIHRLHLSDKIIVPKRVIPRAHLTTVYLRSNIVITPSYYEGLGLSAIEALLSGRPLIATNVSGLNEIVKDGENGILVPAKDPVRLAEAIELLMHNENLVKKLEKNAQKSVEIFDIKKHVVILEKTYREVT